MQPQQKHHETFANEINPYANTRRVLGLKSKSNFPVRAPLRPNTRFFGLTQYSRLQNPFTQQETFGYIPTIEGLPIGHACVAPVILPFGRESDSLSGFGASHILSRHRDILSQHGAHSDVQMVAHFIGALFRSGARLHWQGRHKGSFRICAFRPGIALVVLEYRKKHGEVFWNVITAFRASECEGDFVGSLIPATVHLAA